MKHIIMFSGGIGSWAAALRVYQAYPLGAITVLFADTIIEDNDLYRFLIEGAASLEDLPRPSDLTRRALALPPPTERYLLERKRKLLALASDSMDRIPSLQWVTEGRTPWEVFKDVRFLGNSLIDPCSKILKRQFLRKWLEDRCTPENALIYLGIDWSEEHRFTKAEKFWTPWVVKAPMCDRPLQSKSQMLDLLTERGIRPPRLYRMGFSHNNCGGGCVKAGQGHFKLLLEKLPDVYAEWERREEEVRVHIDRDDVAISRDYRQPGFPPMTLKQLRERIKAKTEIDKYDIGGCGCFEQKDVDE